VANPEWSNYDVKANQWWSRLAKFLTIAATWEEEWTDME